MTSAGTGPSRRGRLIAAVMCLLAVAMVERVLWVWYGPVHVVVQYTTPVQAADLQRVLKRSVTEAEVAQFRDAVYVPYADATNTFGISVRNVRTIRSLFARSRVLGPKPNEIILVDSNTVFVFYKPWFSRMQLESFGQQDWAD